MTMMEERFYAVVMVSNKKREVLLTEGPAYFRTIEAMDAWILRQYKHYETQGFSVSYRTGTAP